MPSEIVKVEVLDTMHVLGVPNIRVTTILGDVHQMPLLSHVKKDLDQDKVGYFRAAWSSIVGWGISDRVENQGW